jgi:SAM-dependent methyltransferase
VKILNISKMIVLLLNPDKYLRDLASQFSHVLNYGCGSKKGQNEIGVDISLETYADIIISQDSFLPFRNGSFELVISRYVLEHIKDVTFVIEEIGRVLKPGGRFVFIVPHCFSQDMYDDPSHTQFFTLRSANYFINKANVYYAGKVFKRAKSYLRLFIVYPHLKIIRLPISFFLGMIGMLFPEFGEQLVKLPFIGASVIVEITK